MNGMGKNQTANQQLNVDEMKKQTTFLLFFKFLDFIGQIIIL